MKKILAVCALAILSIPALADNGIITRWCEGDSVYGTALITNSAAGKARLVVDEVAVGGIVAPASSSTTVTAGQAIAISGSVMPITAATAVTNATIAAVAGGKVGLDVLIVNAGTNAITILDSDPASLSGNLALGQWDTLALNVYATNRIVQKSTSNN